LDMGDPVRIADLAYSMIELSNLTVRDEKNPEGDIEIVVTGLRPGEKLYEELLLGDDPLSTQHIKIQRAQDTFVPWSELEIHLNALEVALGHSNVEEILFLLQKLVVGYRPNDDIVDWMYREQFRLGNRASVLD
jgi:FlaA1/EpsC-like NDP-sugar epimerase